MRRGLKLADYCRLHNLVHDFVVQLLELVYVVRRLDQLDEVFVRGCVRELVVQVVANALASSQYQQNSLVDKIRIADQLERRKEHFQ